LILARWLSNNHRHLKITILLFSAFSVIELGANAIFFHYPGNSYYPEGSFRILCLAGLIYSGVCVLYGQHTQLAKRIAEVIYFYLTMSLIILGCIAVQSTPFRPIDQHILNWSEWMHVDLLQLVHWTTTHPIFHTCMRIAYQCLPQEMLAL
jgi:hypothetical protein